VSQSQFHHGWQLGDLSRMWTERKSFIVPVLCSLNVGVISALNVHWTLLMTKLFIRSKTPRAQSEVAMAAVSAAAQAGGLKRD